MKKLLAGILACCMAFCLVACGGSDSEVHIETEQEKVERVACNRAIAGANVKFDYQISGQTTADATYSKEISDNIWTVSGKVTVKDKYGTPHTYSFDATVQYDETTGDARVTKFN